MRMASISSTTTESSGKTAAACRSIRCCRIPISRAAGMTSSSSTASIDGSMLPRTAVTTLDGIFLDNIGLTYANVENYRRPLWAYLNTPLSFSYATRRVTAYGGDSLAKFCIALRSYLHGKGMIMTGSSSGSDFSWFAHLLDTVGGEVQSDNTLDYAYVRRALSYGKPWSNLFVPPPGAGPPTAAEVLAYLRQALLLGYFPGINGVYWDNSSAYERDRGLFKKYIPLIDAITQAGWEPVNYALSSVPSTLIERFGVASDGKFYLTAQNASSAITTMQITIDGAGLGIPASTPVAARELLSGSNRSVTRTGASIILSETLDPGETVLYELSTTGGPPKTNFTYSPPGPLRSASVQFTDISTNSPTSWSWTFGDPNSGSANTSTARNPTHKYAVPGKYRVKLTASNANGSSRGEHFVTVK